MNIIDVRKREVDGFILVGRHCQRFQTHQLCHSGSGMSGWQPAVSNEVNKVGVGCVSRIMLGVSSLSWKDAQSGDDLMVASMVACRPPPGITGGI